MKQFIAVKAFVEYKGKVLVLKESRRYADGTNMGKYDVPGGRLHIGERYDDALIREVQEETGLAVYLGKTFAVTEWRPMIGGEPAQIVAVFFTATAGGDEVTLSKDHDDAKWIDPELYETEDLIENLEPIFAQYLEWRKK